MLTAGVSSKGGGGKKKKSIHWLIHRKKNNLHTRGLFFIPSCFIIVYTAGLYIALTVGMSL